MDKLSNSCEHVKVGDFISKNTKSLENAKTTGNEILLVCIGKNKRDEIKRELESCKLQKINVNGVIAVQGLEC